jgi:hypothetical protein
MTILTMILIFILIVTLIYAIYGICSYSAKFYLNKVENYKNMNNLPDGSKPISSYSNYNSYLNRSSSNDRFERNLENKVLFDNKDYNENLSVDNKNNQYFYNDIINQSNINETAFNVVNSIDPIDYSNVETGIQKCNKSCKGVCFEMGYTGVATCYPLETQGFDWGTLYKNPTFTYGYNAFGPENLTK